MRKKSEGGKDVGRNVKVWERKDAKGEGRKGKVKRERGKARVGKRRQWKRW